MIKLFEANIYGFSIRVSLFIVHFIPLKGMQITYSRSDKMNKILLTVETLLLKNSSIPLATIIYKYSIYSSLAIKKKHSEIETIQLYKLLIMDESGLSSSSPYKRQDRPNEL